ncbi:MAG TPA: hypothetical protein DCE18_14795 [Syntrophobacteraceae bacterium]|nr:hypothetical protein [Syntrophobacteraceae bacterium]
MPPHDLNQSGNSVIGGDDVQRLRAAHNAARQAAQAAIRDTTRLTRLLTILSDPAPLDLLLDRALAALSELFAADIVLLLDPVGTGTFSPLAAIGLPEDMIDRPMAEAEPGYVAVAMHTKAPVLKTEVGADPKVDPQLRELGAETAVWLPVLDAHDARGVLILARCRPLPFAHSDADLLVAMAYRIGLALEQAQRNTQLKQIVAAGREIGHHLDESIVGAEAVRLLPAVVGADAAALVLSNSSGPPRCVTQVGVDPAWNHVWSRLTDTLLRYSRLAGSLPYCTTDLHAATEQFALDVPKSCPVRALLAIPVGREERVRGLLYAMRYSTRPFRPDTLQVATLYADQLSAALENARLYRAVRESEQRFSTAFQWSPVANTLTSLPEGKFLDVNETFLRDTGYTREEVIGQTHFELRIFDNPVDQAEIRVELLDHGQVYARECRFRTKSGHILICLISVSMVAIDDRPCALSSIIDITKHKSAEQELRESEERLKLALMGADLGMWDWNVVTGKVGFNSRWAEMLGYSPEEIEPHVRTWEMLIHSDDTSYVREVLNSHLAGETPHFETEHRFRTESGKCIWVLDKGKVTHRDGQGRPLRFVGTCLDITEAKQIQSERLSMEHQKQQVWRAESLSRMAGGITHHFNNLLGAVMGNLELALGDLPQEADARLRVAEAMKASHRAAEISQLMLAYLGQTSVKQEPLNLAEATREALPLLLSSIPKHVRLKTRFPSQGPTILADGVHLKQILTNLVSNSAEAIGEQAGEIVVEIGVTAASDMRASRFFPLDWEPHGARYACVSVADTGCGLDAATMERIFDPFFSTKFTGRGLGLAVVLGLVRAHGGAVAVASQPGAGATFRVYFPESEQDAQVPARESVPISAALEGEGLVLLVDDEPMIRTMASALLARLGYGVIDARDGLDAVEKFRIRKDDFLLVILDLTMPLMDGWETLAALRAVRSDIPVVLSSGYDEAQVMRGHHSEQPQAFLRKPYGMKDLTAALRAACSVPPVTSKEG